MSKRFHGPGDSEPVYFCGSPPLLFRTDPKKGTEFNSKVLSWPVDTFPSDLLPQKTEGAMHIPQRKFSSFLFCFALIMFLPVALPAKAGMGIS
jgi:hypothetical protein